jgi:NTE family protein
VPGAGGRVVTVFGGGGAKAAAHAGAQQAIIEAGLQPVHYLGTSMGAVLASCFAAGLSPAEVRTRMAGIKRVDVARTRRLAAVRGLKAPSLFYIEPLRTVIENLVPSRSFDQLAISLTVTAVDLETGDLALFGAGGRQVPLVDALLASCALPFFYPAVSIEGKRYADGGLRAVLPLETAAGMGADLVIAVDTGPGFDEGQEEKAPLPPLLDAHNTATGLLMASNTVQALALWRANPARPPLIYVRPRVDKHVTFRVDLAGKYAEEGYRATRAALQAAGLIAAD